MKPNKIHRLVIVTVLYLFTYTAYVHADDYLAFNVIGKVQYEKSGQLVDLNMKERFPVNAVVHIPQGAKLEVLNEKDRQRYILSKPGKGTVTVLAQATGNRTMELTMRYITYVKKQMTNKGLTSKQRLTDFATVTRHKAEVADENEQPKSFADKMKEKFNAFRNASAEKFKSFRDECNKKYTEFVRKAWEEFGSVEPLKCPQIPEVEPKVYNPEQDEPKVEPKSEPKVEPKAQPKAEPKVESKNEPKNDPVAEPKKELQPEAPAKPEAPRQNLELLHPKIIIEPIKPEDLEQPQPLEIIPEHKIDADQIDFSHIPFEFYGTELSVRLSELQRLHLPTIQPNDVANQLEKLNTPEYNNLLIDCLNIRKEHQFCDWAYLLMLKSLSDEYCGSGTNEAALMCGWLYAQSGYQVRYASSIDNEHLYLLIASKHSVYDKSGYIIDGTNYYPLEDISGRVNVCKAPMEQEKSMSLYVAQDQKFDMKSKGTRTIKSARFPDFNFTVDINQNLIDFYANYPSSCINNDFTTRWQMYANTPLDETVKDVIYPVLKEKLSGMKDIDAVNHLLNLVQTGLEYKYDEEVWGEDRAFFAEETLNYPFCDCEDRSILFTRLVRDLLGLKCVLIYYPGHLGAAVNIPSGARGTYYNYNGADYTVCDPTYIGADAGMQMSMFSNDDATLIALE